MDNGVSNTIGKMERYDRRALTVFSVTGIILIGVGEMGAFYFGMADRHGLGPLFLRVLVYVIGSTVLWDRILREKRRRIGSLLRRNERVYNGLLQAYEGALGLKDPYTGGHSRRVAAYAAIISRSLELSSTEQGRIKRAALIHDVGKIGIPDEILLKPGSLTPEEFSTVKKHAAVGADLVAGIPVLRDLSPAVRHHHERYDGTGYPDGIKGSDIPVDARVIAVADTLDAITTNRTYRAKRTFRHAVEELRRGAGSAFDPVIIAAVLQKETLTQLFRRSNYYDSDTDAPLKGDQNDYSAHLTTWL
jgi:HD-GYP domain-containing protein (c-di-GMP phosphodiesterase class II)